MAQTFDCEAKASMRQLMLTFMRNTKRVIQVFLPEESQLFFKPSKAPIPRLKSLGFSNYTAAMCGSITGLTQEQKQCLAKCIVSLRHTFSRKSSEAWQAGELMLRPVKISYRAALSFTHSKLFAKHDPKLNHDFFENLADKPTLKQPKSFKLVCPACKVIKEVAHIGLRHSDKWNSIKCVVCSKSRTSRQWLCTCTLTWHSCPIHALIGHACGTEEKAKRDHRAAQINASKSSHDSTSLPNSLGSFRGSKGTHTKRKFSDGPQGKGRVGITKRICLTPNTGIPRSFLTAKLATRFNTSVNIEQKEPASLSCGSSGSLVSLSF